MSDSVTFDSLRTALVPEDLLSPRKPHESYNLPNNILFTPFREVAQAKNERNFNFSKIFAFRGAIGFAEKLRYFGSNVYHGPGHGGATTTLHTT